jgi:predicted secreted hydrolase
MLRPTRRAVLAAALAPALARAQGFAGMGAEAEGYAPVVRGVPLVFPRDHGPHPDFRIEWWYVTAALTDEDGDPCGVQWTLFRNALAPHDRGTGWDSAQLWMAHAACTTATTHRAAETFARGGIGQAGVTRPPFDAWIDDWRLSGPDDGFDVLRMSANGEGFAYGLSLTATGPLVLHGDGGFSLKAERGQASYYYSQPFLRAEGTLTLDGRTRRVTGDAWLDREWSSQPLDADQVGWDWFSLVLSDGTRVMLYRIRSVSGRDSFTGTWIAPDGAAEFLDRDAAELEPLGFAEVAGRKTPVRWAVRVPSRDFSAEVAALNPQAWNSLAVSYWEGPVSVTGARPGRGYLEMTGY